MTQPSALSSSTQNSEKLNQACFKFPPGVIIPVYLQFNGYNLLADNKYNIHLVMDYYKSWILIGFSTMDYS